MDIFLESGADSGLFRHYPGTLGDAFPDRGKTARLPVVRGNMAAAGAFWIIFWIGDGSVDSKLYGAADVSWGKYAGEVRKYSGIGPDRGRRRLFSYRASQVSKFLLPARNCVGVDGDRRKTK